MDSSQADRPILTSIRLVLKCCHQIHDLLKTDRDNYVANDFKKIEESNKKKHDLLQSLSVIIEKMNHPTQLANQFPDNLPQQINQLEQSTREEIQKIMRELRVIAKECIRHLTVNSHIVYTNIGQIKELLDRIAAASQVSHVYDRNGNAVNFNKR